jgi:hypothetical protein
MNRRLALSILLLSPAIASGHITWAAANETAAPVKKLLKSEVEMAINNASASGWSESMADVDLLPTFASSPQRAQSSEIALKNQAPAFGFDLTRTPR